MKWRTLHQGAVRANQGRFGVSGRMEMRAQAAWRQLVAIAMRSFVRELRSVFGFGDAEDRVWVFVWIWVRHGLQRVILVE
jgi:hypothetical protein